MDLKLELRKIVADAMGCPNYEDGFCIDPSCPERTAISRKCHCFEAVRLVLGRIRQVI